MRRPNSLKISIIRGGLIYDADLVTEAIHYVERFLDMNMYDFRNIAPRRPCYA